MDYYIQNQYLKATISGHGAELIELFDGDGINRMHDYKNDAWHRVSPVLFPQISRMKDFCYKVNGQTYPMPSHGYFRDLDFSPIQQSKDSITFFHQSDDQSKTMFPYDYKFYVTYTLVNNSLKVSFKVINTGNSVLRYMLGGHPGFKVPVYDNETYEDYYVKFEQKETVQAMQVIDNFLANVYKPCLNNEDTINLKHSLFDPDAIIVRGYKSKYCDLLSRKSDKQIRFYFSDFEIFAIWSVLDEKSNFVCFEPWNGIPKNFVIDHEDMGVLTLQPNKEDNFSYTIEVVK